MTRSGAAVINKLQGESGGVLLQSLFVSIDLEADVAYVAYEDDSSIKWDELPRVDGEFLAGLGAKAVVHVPSRPARPRIDAFRGRRGGP